MLVNGIAGSYGKYIFNFMGHYQAVFQSRSALLPSQRCLRVPVLHILGLTDDFSYSPEQRYDY